MALGFGLAPALAQGAGGEESKAVRQAAKLAAALQYDEAVRMLELAMVEGDTSETLMMDLAGYYRKVGNLRMATALCKPLVDKARPRPWHLLEVASMLVDQGRFTDAESYLKRFEEMKAEDPRADILRARAKARFSVRDLYPTATLDTFLHNTLADDGFPFLADSILYWSSDRQGSKRSSGWTGRAMVGIYTTRLDSEDGYAPPVRLPTKFNRGVLNVASPWLSPGGDTLYFSANAAEANLRGELNMQLHYAVRDKHGRWADDAYEVPGQPSEVNCLHPSVSADGAYLYFAADAAATRGGLDLYRMRILGGGAYGSPDNLGSAVNTDRHDAFPVAARDGRLFFSSQGHTGLGGFDVFVTTEGPDGKWSAPVNVGEPINSDGDETGWLPVRPGFGYLVSDRNGDDDDVYEVRW